VLGAVPRRLPRADADVVRRSEPGAAAVVIILRSIVACRTIVGTYTTAVNAAPLDAGEVPRGLLVLVICCVRPCYRSGFCVTSPTLRFRTTRPTSLGGTRFTLARTSYTASYALRGVVLSGTAQWSSLLSWALYRYSPLRVASPSRRIASHHRCWGFWHDLAVHLLACHHSSTPDV